MNTRTRRRPSTRSADQLLTVWMTASAIKPRTRRLTATTETRTLATGAIQRQLTKLKAVTAIQIGPCHQRILKASSNSARVNNQNTTTFPVESAINGACQIENGTVTPMPEVS